LNLQRLASGYQTAEGWHAAGGQPLEMQNSIARGWRGHMFLFFAGIILHI
jgi:hypothetical protein